MSAITALITGTLAQVPIARSTAKGNAMATGSLAVQASADGKPAYVGLLAFGSEAEALLQCDKGDVVAVRGRLELNRWTSKEGDAREGWQLIADSLLAGPEKPAPAKTAPRSKRPTPQAAQRFQAPEPALFDDAVPL